MYLNRGAFALHVLGPGFDPWHPTYTHALKHTQTLDFLTDIMDLH